MRQQHNEVVFRKDGGEITSLTTGQKTPFRRLGNVYVMDMWIKVPECVKESQPVRMSDGRIPQRPKDDDMDVCFVGRGR